MQVKHVKLIPVGQGWTGSDHPLARCPETRIQKTQTPQQGRSDCQLDARGNAHASIQLNVAVSEVLASSMMLWYINGQLELADAP